MLLYFTEVRDDESKAHRWNIPSKTNRMGENQWHATHSRTKGNYASSKALGINGWTTKLHVSHALQSTHVSKISHSWNDYTCECKREVALFKNSCPCCVGNISPAEVISCTERTVAFCRRQNNCHWRHKAGSFWYDDGYFVLQHGNTECKSHPKYEGTWLGLRGNREGHASRWLHHLAVGVSREPIFARPNDENIDLLVWSSCCYFHHSLRS